MTGQKGKVTFTTFKVIGLERKVNLVLILMSIGVFISYWIPVWVVRVQKSDKPIRGFVHWMIIVLFLIFFTVSWMKWESRIEFLIFIPCLLILLLISLSDYWFGLIPDKFTYPSIVLLAIVRWFIHPESSVYYYLAMMLGGCGIFVLAFLTRGIGIGDAKLVGLGGLMVGLPDIFLAFWLATISGTVYIVMRFILNDQIGRKTPIPFGPHLSLGIVLAYLYGDRILSFFFHPRFYLF